MRTTLFLRTSATALALLAIISTTTAMPAGADSSAKAEKVEKAEKAESNGDKPHDDRTADATEHANEQRRSSNDTDGKPAADTKDDGAGRAAAKPAGTDEPKAGGGEGTADITVVTDCHTVTVTSSKDISHVVVFFADGTSRKFEGLSGHTWTMTFTETLASARAKSATTVVSDVADCGSTAAESDAVVTDECADDEVMSDAGTCTSGKPGTLPICPSGTEMVLDGSCVGDPVDGECPSGTTMTDGSCVGAATCPSGSTMTDPATCTVDAVDAVDAADAESCDAGAAADAVDADGEACVAVLSAGALNIDTGEVASAMRSTPAEPAESSDSGVVHALSAGAARVASVAGATLAFTGASISTILLVGLLAFAGGAALLVGSRRRKQI